MSLIHIINRWAGFFKIEVQATHCPIRRRPEGDWSYVPFSDLSEIDGFATHDDHHNEWSTLLVRRGSYKQPRHADNQSVATPGCFQQHRAIIGGMLPLVECQHSRLGDNLRKQQMLCRGRIGQVRASQCALNTVHFDVFVAQNTFAKSAFRNYPGEIDQTITSHDSLSVMTFTKHSVLDMFSLRVLPNATRSVAAYHGFSHAAGASPHLVRANSPCSFAVESSPTHTSKCSGSRTHFFSIVLQ